ncbi:MAG: DUF6062 family protein [Clostridia bacterium]|nr:DUF6062 family protein [Clostridia bacterium]
MLEKIYTIPVNEAFDECSNDPSLGCPFCRLRDKTENDSLEHILGDAMMEPSTRIETNEKGFCRRHYDMMLTRKNRLGMALMLESHMIELRKSLDASSLSELVSGKGAKAIARIKELSDTCYVCERVESMLTHMIENAALLWDTEKEFRDKTAKQPYFCLTHYREFLLLGKAEIKGRRYNDFASEIKKIELAAFDSIAADVSHFCKKFDYRYENEPWGTAKDAPDRAVKFLS